MGFPSLSLENNHAESCQHHSQSPTSTVFPELLVLARVHGHSWMWAAPAWASWGWGGGHGTAAGQGVSGPSLIAAGQVVTAEVQLQGLVCLGLR